MTFPNPDRVPGWPVTGWEPSGDTEAEFITRLSGEAVVSDTPEDPDLPEPTHWADQTASGAGDGSSATDPFLVSDFLALPPSPGDCLGMLDNVYSGADALITPEDLHGTEENPITFRAINDGEVRIDGGGENPIDLLTCSYIHIRGIDAHNGRNNVVRMTNTSHHNYIARGCFWDTDPILNGAVVDVSDSGSDFNLIEDCAAFGIGRRLFQSSQLHESTTFRRCWGNWERWDESGVKKAVQIGYQGHHDTVENCIVHWSRSGGSSSSERGNLCIGRIDKPSGYDPDGDNHILASMAIVLDPEGSAPTQLVDGFQGITSSEPAGHGGNTIRDLICYTERVTKSGRMVRLQNQDPASVYADITEIGDSGGSSSISTDWAVSNRAQYDTVADALAAGASPWDEPGTGGRMLYRTVNRTLTTDLLWPWPMDARIRAALTDSGRDPDVIFRGAGNSVTELVESIFEPIPGI